MTRWVALVGMAGSLLLGAGVFGLWILENPVSYASYLVAVGGLGLGVSLWFGQPEESGVAVGDAGIALEDGRQGVRLRWYQIRSIRIEKGVFVATGESKSLRFGIGANQRAAAWALKEAAERVPDVVDVPAGISGQLPRPDASAGLDGPVENDQLTGSHCAATKQLITLEEDARICGICGQIYHKSGVPERCVSCEAELKGRTLRA